ncbi:hypothetical protein EUX98_g7871 [Antrodiella citrinella]|uniref:Uncharacterized protein n=1 Tax=Antrodiella citrinella TaxID=2447956 RepID=A0A4S4MM52_9APHY|nr:hypothetical protein EUX98_g7871 [Antrodiella citrinella]
MYSLPAAHSSSSHPECVEEARWTNHDEDLERHRGAHNFRHLVKSSFNLPLNSDVLYFLARGSLSRGSIKITDDGNNGDDKVVVGVSFLYMHDVAPEKIQVCRLQRDGSKNGVGIFSPNSLPPHHHDDEYRSQFSVVVHLPNGAGNPHLYGAFDTDMPMFAHYLGDLDPSVAFCSIDLKTVNAPIHVQSLTIEDGSLKTSNSPIEGKITAFRHLELHTSNGPLKTDITLSNRNGANATSLVLSTQNSLIQSSISLISLTETSTGGSFDIAATTSNSPIDVVYPTIPVNSTLKFDGRSSNSPVRATLHTGYEGSFALATSMWNKPAIHFDRSAEDPSGAGRRRALETISLGYGAHNGHVYWGSGARKNAGSVQLSTFNADVQLIL